jgi:WD40 repeat protein
MKNSFSILVVLLLIALSSTAFSIDPQLVWKIDGQAAIPLSYTISNDGNTLYIQYNIRKGEIKTLNIYIWDIPGNKLIDSIPADLEFYGMVVSDDQKYLACMNIYSNWTSVFDINSRKHLRDDKANTNSLDNPGIFSFCKITGKSIYAVYEYSYKKVQVFDFETGNKLKDIDCEGSDNFRINFSDDGKLLCAMNNKDTTINIYSLTDGSLIRKIKVPNTFEQVCFAKNKPYIVVNYSNNKTNNNKKIQVYDYNSGELIKEFDSKIETNYSIFLDDDENIITGFLKSSYLQIYNLKTGHQSVYNGNYRGNLLENYGFGNKFCIVKYEGDFEIINFDDSTTVFKIETKTNDNHLKCRTAKITPDGKNIVTADMDNGTIFIRDLLTGSVVKKFDIQTNAISLDFTADSKLMITDDNNSNIKLWNIEDISNPVFVKNFQLISSQRASISADGLKIIAGGLGSVISLIDVETGKITYLDTVLSDIRSISFSSDKQKIICCTKWNLIVMEYDNTQQTYIRKATIQADSSKDQYSGGITNVSFSKDGKFITVAASDYRVRVYSADNYKFIRAFKPPTGQTQSGRTNKAIIFENNEYLFIADGIPGLRIYNNKIGNLIWSELFSIQGDIIGADITQDDKYLFTAINDGTMVLYDLNGPNSIEEKLISNNDKLNIFPNPARDYIEISSINPTLKRGVNEGSDIQIFDMLGIVLSTAGGGIKGGGRIDISNLSPGIYFIKIGNRAAKFVKM